jgi:hypothetical protein
MKNGRIVRIIALIVALGFALPSVPLRAADPPPGLLKKIADRENVTAMARENYTYRQSVTMQEIDEHGKVGGEYHSVTDVTFSPERGRYEQVVQPPSNTLLRLKLTPEDFHDIRDIDPLLLTTAQVSLYEGEYKGEETIEGYPCFLMYVQPKQILSGQRFFQGTLWVRQSDFSVIKSEGQAVPQIETTKMQNLTPHFTTLFREVDGQWFFPGQTYADDTLYFRDWPQRIRIIIQYSNYKKFAASSTITFGNTNQNQQSSPPPVQPPPPRQR